MHLAKNAVGAKDFTPVFPSIHNSCAREISVDFIINQGSHFLRSFRTNCHAYMHIINYYAQQSLN
jgi:hypothetical protein